MNVNGIGVNGVNPYKVNPKTTSEEAEKEEAVSQESTATNYKSPEEVLDLMAKASMQNQVKAKKTISISQYVTPEQAARIAGYATQGLNALDKYANAAKSELGVSDEDAQNLAVEVFEYANY